MPGLMPLWLVVLGAVVMLSGMCYHLFMAARTICYLLLVRIVVLLVALVLSAVWFHELTAARADDDGATDDGRPRPLFVFTAVALAIVVVMVAVALGRLPGSIPREPVRRQRRR